LSEVSFKKQLDWLTQHTTLVSLGELLEADNTDRIMVAITFDDGYTSLSQNAADILAEVGVSATVYLNTAWIDENAHRASDPKLGHYPDETFLSWTDVRHLHSLGWCIGSHGADHLDLTVLPGLEMEKELVVSKQVIEEKLGVACNHFSYPWGRHNAQVRAAVEKAGYSYAAAALHGPVKAGFDPMAFPRINIDKHYTLDDFKAIVRGDWDYLGWLHKVRQLRT
jgi:peptidoglycan/xylan/chitin deacetylase (PgdA/CDA1 family)